MWGCNHSHRARLASSAASVIMSCDDSEHLWFVRETQQILHWSCTGHFRIDSRKKMNWWKKLEIIKKKNTLAENTVKDQRKLHFTPVFTTHRPTYAFYFWWQWSYCHLCAWLASLSSCWSVRLFLLLDTNTPSKMNRGKAFLTAFYHYKLGWSSPVPSASPVTNYQFIFIVQISCTACLIWMQIPPPPPNLDSSVINFFSIHVSILGYTSCVSAGKSVE